jgi:probable F420-dependent oxidoreductase
MAHHRRFRFGTGGFPATSRLALTTLARKVEDLGYSTLLVPDHFDPDLLDPWLALLTAAEATTTLRVGTFVCDNDFWHPATLARAATTLDLMSEGRLELGLGAGWKREDYTITNIPFDPPNVRIGRLSEAIQIIKKLFTEPSVSFTGEHYSIDNFELQAKPLQKPYPPLLIGGGRRRLLSLAGREASIVGLLMRSSGGGLDMTDCSSAATTQKIEWVRQAAGERFSEVEMNTLVFGVVITDQRHKVADEVGRQLGVTAEQILDSIHYLIGTVDQIVEDIQRWRERFGISYIAVFPQYMDDFAPVVARLHGQ